MSGTLLKMLALTGPRNRSAETAKAKQTLRSSGRVGELGAFELDTVVVGDCLDVMAQMPDGCVDLVVTDPPYGCGKADWDDKFPILWYREAQRLAPTVVVITGSAGLADSIPLVGSDFVDVIAAWNTNGMTRGPLGFGNWLAAVIAGDKIRQGRNFFEFAVSGVKPPHPSPKPEVYMKCLIARISDSTQVVFDPFMGSGTTAVAAKQLGRHFFGCDICPEYVEIACKRLSQLQLALL